MLLSRLVTALILVPLVFLAVLKLTEGWFTLLLDLVVLAACWELTRLAGLKSVNLRLLTVLIMGVVLYFLYVLENEPWTSGFLQLLAAWWLLNLVIMLSGRIRIAPFEGRRPLRLLIGMLFLAGAWLALAKLHALPEVGPELMMFLLVLVWIADSAAYFSGRALGRHKLAPAISPGKTVEGAIGALASAVIPAGFLVWSGWVQAPAWMLVLLCILTVAVSIGGDLWESVLKRERGVKDSGTILPGHGGVLDRIDSQIAASPFFVAGLAVVGVPL
ncbi:MAG: phosphatidate cytidylyltransferase [Gammaproteobacteria bacterium]|nr:MAG: phosphatidate cytidylyltransferase [Gammaproteobacteria bacterium]RTZ75988.1 MAG: phosphatidate cytidylyltransferase [Gammaproteobacteria bacterium]RTZ76724.1 MAG: phosphatidate cytidylyltransferase [Gammaproteobacteria bacterium]